ncbi:MAG: hypothetical protein LQ340_005501 [Diploschistes diacapsis]|nr:MAG: hypothetical protein LQ340_005501 [Diploschistes diacapsis]
MPRGHEYHQPNAPNSIPDNLDDSDLELDLRELGPFYYQDNSSDGHGRGALRRDADQIPLGPLQGRASGRRAKRFQDTVDDGGYKVSSAGPATQEDEHSEGHPAGDSTPLLQQDGNTQARDPAASSGLAGRMGLSAFKSRKAGYHNIEQSVADASEAGVKSAPRSINIGQYPPPRFPPNAISNAKYTPWSFLPRMLYNEFSFFINLYFLIVALSQLIPPLRIGVLWTYMAPLAFVLSVTLGKEAYDDVIRRRRDGEANRELYTMLQLRGPAAGSQSKKKKRGRSKPNGYRNPPGADRLDANDCEEEQTGGSIPEIDEIYVKSRDIKVGDVLKLYKNDRVPADVVILKSYTSESSAVSIGLAHVKQPDLLFEQGDENNPPRAEPSNQGSRSEANLTAADEGGNGETFIRTDQLDGETDWKLRLATPLTQSLLPADFTRLTIAAGKPSKKVNEFLGRIELAPKITEGRGSHGTGEAVEDQQASSAPLSIDNTAWANTILASNATILAVVIYTGAQTRQALSTSASRSKVGLLELEINNLTKILCALTLTLAGVLVAFQAYYKELQKEWYVSVCRFLILFSSIIPISIRVNLDIGKTVYAYFIQHDKDMPDAVVRTSTIPEDLGRIEYLLSDKTGTLTQNGKKAA